MGLLSVEVDVDVVVTRHPALVTHLIEIGIANEATPVLPHVTAEDVRGKVVAGVLPLSLAAEAEAVIEVPLRLQPEDRGRELSLERLREIAEPPVIHRVERM